MANLIYKMNVLQEEYDELVKQKEKAAIEDKVPSPQESTVESKQTEKKVKTKQPTPQEN
jgi:hypothetical protein